VDGRIYEEPSRTEQSVFGNVGSAWYSSLFYLYIEFTKNGLTFGGIDGAELGNGVTVVVNCYEGDSPTPHCCKCDKSECYCIENFAII